LSTTDIKILIEFQAIAIKAINHQCPSTSTIPLSMIRQKCLPQNYEFYPCTRCDMAYISDACSGSCIHIVIHSVKIHCATKFTCYPGRSVGEVSGVGIAA